MRRNEENIKIGTIVIDDVHACIEVIEQQYTVDINSKTEVYKNICNLLKEPIKKYSREKFFYLFDDPRKYTDMLLPFWIWQEKYIEIKRLLENASITDKEQYDFNFPLLDDSFLTCNCTISLDNIEITPQCIDLSKIKSFESAQRRVFLSATLSDDSVFITTLGLKKEEISGIITPEKANDIGDRLMLFPEYLNPKVGNEQIKDQLVLLAKKYNVVILVPSFERAKHWESVAHQILSTRDKNIESGINKIKSIVAGITVIVNKYDGIDLPYDACRILVIDGLPLARSLYEASLQSMNPNDMHLLRERIQKIEQGIGRGVRSNTDFCVVVFLGKTLTNLIVQNDGVEFFSDTTKAQYKLSHRLWEQIRKGNPSPTVEEIFSLADYSLYRNIDWIEASKAVLNEINYVKSLKIDSVALAFRRAFEFSKNGDINSSCKILEDEKNFIKDDMTRGYIMQLIAMYKNFSNKQEAQEILIAAQKYNGQLIKPIEGLKYKKMNSNTPQIKNIFSYLKKFNDDVNHAYLELLSITDDLQFVNVSYKRFEESIKNIFTAIGYYSTRPDNEYNSGPDNLVALGNTEYLVIECKSESDSDRISKSDCDQMSGSIQWFESKYKGDGFKYYPILIHNSNIFNRDSSPNAQLRIMTKELLEKLKMNIEGFYTSWNNSDKQMDQDKVMQILDHFELTPSKITTSYTKEYKIQR